MQGGNDMGKLGSVKVILPREFFNSLIAVLNSFQTGDSSNKYFQYAQRLRKKILRYSRKFSKRDTEQAITHYYEDEAAILIKLLIMYCYATGTVGADMFEMIGKERDKHDVES